MNSSSLARSLKVAVLTGALVSGSAFATCECGTVIVKKFYDANANGIQDANEPRLSNWKFHLTSVTRAVDSTKFTDAFGYASWGTLSASDYSMEEGAPVQGNWVQTTPTDGSGHPVNPLTGIVVSPGHTTQLTFGNYCTKDSGGRTPGYWSNKNGFNTLMDGGTLIPELTLLSNLNLKDANGLNFDPASYDQFRTWLLGATATNMAYKLSSHLAAMRLNVEAGFVNGNRIYAPFGGTINELMTLANQSLAANPITFPGNPERAYQEQLKDYLDQLNNGAPVVSPTPCPYSF